MHHLPLGKTSQTSVTNAIVRATEARRPGPEVTERSPVPSPTARVRTWSWRPRAHCESPDRGR